MDPLEPENSHGPIKVALIEDDVTYRSCVLLALRRAKGIVSTHVFSSCEEALRILQPDDPPDVLLLDLQLPGISGTDGIRQLRALNPSIRIVVLTVSEQENEVFRAIYEGAAGYLLKSDSTAKVAEAIIQASAGGSPLTPRIAKLVLERVARSNVDSRTHTLTQREREILRLAAQGLTLKAIASRLGLSFHTINTHMRRTYEKLGVCSRSAAVTKALRTGLFV